MKFVETDYFTQQLHKLKATYVKAVDDYEDFKSQYKTAFSIHLGGGIYKARSKNSSIPVGKSGGFRFIIKVYKDIAVPIMVYAKSIKQNVSENEIIDGLEKTLIELNRMKITK